MKEILWEVNPDKFEATELFHFKTWVEKKYKINFSNYEDLWQWSVNQKENFWSEAWDFFKLIGIKGNKVLNNPDSFINSQWFPEAKLNYAENLLQKMIHSKEPNSEAIIFWGEDKIKTSLSQKEFLNLISKTAQALKDNGVLKGDCVCAMVPNHPLALISMLATTSLGAIWTSCSPDFGIQGVLDRFSQVTPKLFFTCDYYYYNGKKIDCLEKTKEILQSLLTVENTVVLNYDYNFSTETTKETKSEIETQTKTQTTKEGSSSVAAKTAKVQKIINFPAFIKNYIENKIDFALVDFNHPLYILYSSGTTGIPKCIVHGHGGTLIQHLKEHRLHSDLKSKDVLFYFTTCGWMMWNWLVSGLATNAKILLYDGSPFYNEGKILFKFAETFHCTHFGTSAKFIDACAKANLDPKSLFNLSSIRLILSTGSPLNAEGFDYVYQKISPTAQLASISGGTDIVSCFVLGSPWSPVYRGEISVPGLGMHIDIWDENKKSLQNVKGELVCKSTFPSKPIGFWNDPNNEKFHKAYFEKFENIWCHGDFVEKTNHGGFIIYGRSDATLNPGGVRIGTAEIYRQVEQLPEVEESIVIGQDWQNDVRVVLFVKLKTGLTLDNELIDKIKNQIRKNTTPRHVPSKVLQVIEIPRTKSGKIVELAVKQVVQGEIVKNKEALANPEALENFKNRLELQS